MASGTAVTNKTVELPALAIAGTTLPKVQADLEYPSPGEGLHFNILGNDILKRFNVIIDYQRSLVYLKPNRHFADPYNSVFDMRILFATGSLILIGLLAAYALLRSRRRQARLLAGQKAPANEQP